MERAEFVEIRKRLHKTQKEMSQLLGVSLKAVHSYEQGWRSVPAHVERQIYFLLSRKIHDQETLRKCWDIKNCPPERRDRCPAWEFRSGTLCWFINGTLCQCSAQRNWQEKMMVCKQCEILQHLLDLEGDE